MHDLSLASAGLIAFFLYRWVQFIASAADSGELRLTSQLMYRTIFGVHALLVMMDSIPAWTMVIAGIELTLCITAVPYLRAYVSSLPDDGNSFRVQITHAFIDFLSIPLWIILTAVYPWGIGSWLWSAHILLHILDIMPPGDEIQNPSRFSVITFGGVSNGCATLCD